LRTEMKGYIASREGVRGLLYNALCREFWVGNSLSITFVPWGKGQAWITTTIVLM
jgi:hypothetical protein